MMCEDNEKAKEKSDGQQDLLDIEPEEHKESAAKDIKKEFNDAKQDSADAANRQTG